MQKGIKNICVFVGLNIMQKKNSKVQAHPRHTKFPQVQVDVATSSTHALHRNNRYHVDVEKL
jgi:hypothetical protein